jgi:hypothetical protein
MQKQIIGVPQSADPAEWQSFIDQTIPPIEQTKDERNLSRLRERATQAFVNLTTHHRVLPVNPVCYEGRMSDYLQFAFEHL